MIAGYFSFQAGRVNFDACLDFLSSNPLADIPYSSTSLWHDSDGFLIQQNHRATALGSQNHKPLLCHTESGTCVAAWARIDNRKELLKAFSGDFEQLGETDEALILASYLKWGQQCCEHLIGDFAFVIYDAKNQLCFLARDHTGAKPLYYYIDNNQLFFATSQAVFDQAKSAGLELDLSLSEEWLSRYLISRSTDWSKTSFTRVKKVPPAHNVAVSLDTKAAEIRPYFEFSHSSDLLLSSDQEYVDAYREVLDEAVRCRVQDSGLIGSELSGGLDSSSITAIAARLIENAETRLHGFGVANYELEPGCIMAVSQTSPIAMTHLSTYSQGHFAPESDFYDSVGTPQEHGSAMGHFPLYKACNDLGVAVLLSGFGGDEFTTSEAPTALVELWRERKMRLFLSRQRGNWLTKPAHTARWLYHYYRFNNQSITSRRMQKAGHLNWPFNLVKQELIDKHELADHYLKPLKYDGEQITQNGFALNNRWSPMMSTRYEHCTLMAARYGIEYRWPLMDIRLLKLFLSIPASQKLGPRMVGRYLHRRAVADVLPPFITWKKKDMVTMNLFKKLFKGDRYLQSLATPKRQVLKAATRKIETNTKPAPSPEQPRFEDEINDLIDQQKITALQQTMRSPSSTQFQNQASFSHIRQLNQLNQWLYYRKMKQANFK